MYQNTDFNKGPIHTISNHISLCRFQQIKQYCHISCLKSNENNRYHLPSNKIWWYKVEPLALALQASFQQYYSPSSKVSINELMVQCFGRYVTPPFSPPFSTNLYTNPFLRSLHTYKMSNKPIMQGYKIYGIADHGYLYNFLQSS